MSLPDISELDQADVPAWERQHGEPAKQHAAFRLYRDQPAARRSMEPVADEAEVSVRRVREWAVEWNWRERAEAWDDQCHRIEDAERLDAIREMHQIHRRAGRAAVVKALQALTNLDMNGMPANSVIRLLDVGTRLERSTLTVSVEELQGLGLEEEREDPWARIAAELSPADEHAVE
jgi:paraquat-inducible protein B